MELEKIWDKIKIIIYREIPNLDKFKNKKISLTIASIILLLAITLPLIGTYVLIQIIGPMIKIFVNNFGIQAFGDSVGVISVCLIFFGLIAYSKFLRYVISKNKPKWIGFLMCSITITVFLVGMVFISAVVGAPNTEWELYDQDNNHLANIKCHNDGRLILGDKIYCSVKSSDIKFQQIKGKADLFFINGSYDRQELKPNDLYFITYEKIDKIVLELEGRTKENRSLNLYTTFYPDFYTIQKDEQRQNQFLTYFFGLLFLSLITIPQLILKISKEMGVRRREGK